MPGAKSPLVRFPSTTVLLPMHHCGSVAYYALMSAYSHSVIDCAMRHVKNHKYTHRQLIADTHGPLRLTVPVSVAPHAAARPLSWADMVVSPQAHWWDVHLTALESAYGRTPFFQFYIDRFAPLYTPRYQSESVPLHELNRAYTLQICDILGIEAPEFNTHQTLLAPLPPHTLDLRRHPDIEHLVATVPYYQVRSHTLGFIGGLSILDLIFNLGPEAPLILRRMTEQLR